MKRGSKKRELRRSRITVIGEGLTERYYFQHLRSIKGYKFDCKPRFFTHQSYEEMRKLIEWVIQNGGIAICVCDADITRISKEENARLKAIEKDFANRDDVLVCKSMPSIEFWFLIHYIETNKHFLDSKEVIQVLKKWIPNYCKSGSFLEKEQWVAALCSDNKLKDACTRASTIAANPDSASYSDIYKAIRLLEETR